MTLDDLTNEHYSRATLTALAIGATCLYGTVTDADLRDVIGTAIMLVPAFCIGAYVGIRAYRRSNDPPPKEH